MASFTGIEGIKGVAGVSQYIFLRQGGQIISHNVENHIILSSMALTCASICRFACDDRFKYLVFSQDDGRDFYIFPMDAHYLAVIKTAESKAADLPKNVAAFIKMLHKELK